jgi:hypothetical protein
LFSVRGKKIVTQPEPDWARLRPLFVLEKLSSRLRSDVLADGSIISACRFNAQRPTQLAEDVVVSRDELFAAFRDAQAAPTERQLRTANGAVVDAKISVNEDGSGTVEVAGKMIRFPWVALLSSEPSKRLSELERFLTNFPISEYDGDALRARVVRDDFSGDDFINAAMLLESSPEMFTERLVDKLRRQQGRHQISAADVLPDDDRYWNHLLPQLADAQTLSDYIGHEMDDAWRIGLEANSRRAFHSLAIMFGAPEVIPQERLRGLSAPDLANAIEAMTNLEDPFSLVGTLEICAERAATDQRFADLGRRLLDGLFGDMQRMTGACALFGAIFVIATAHLATHETLQRRPVFWRRLASVAHASLVVRICGGDGIDADGIISWAMRLFGNEYFLSVVADFAVEPQWRPEWILPKILVADLFGRVVSVWRHFPQESAPTGWKERLDRAYEWIVAEKIGTFSQYPAVLQGTRRVRRPTLADFEDMPQGGDAFRTLASVPTANTLISISPFIAAFGFPDEATRDIEKVLASIRSAPIEEDDKLDVVALSMLSHIAVLTENVGLAESVSEVCLERARRTEAKGTIFEIVCRLVECTAVIKEREEAARVLARRLEILASIVPQSDGAKALAFTIDLLKSIQPQLAPLLGRAKSIARLGSPRAAA